MTSDNTGANRARSSVKRYANGAAIGPRRFRADIENIGAFGGEAAGMHDRGLRIEIAAAVGK